MTGPTNPPVTRPGQAAPLSSGQRPLSCPPSDLPWPPPEIGWGQGVSSAFVRLQGIRGWWGRRGGAELLSDPHKSANPQFLFQASRVQCSCLENPRDSGACWDAVHGVAKRQTQLNDFTFTSQFHALEKEMATHSSVLAWRIPGSEEPGGPPAAAAGTYSSDKQECKFTLS